MDRIFSRQLHDLEKVFRFIQEAFIEYQLDQSLIFWANFIVEELFTNMVKYNHTTNDVITICVEKNQHSLIISMIDYDVDSFDPRTTKDIDISKPAHERSVGGLGNFLVKKIVHTIDYEYVNRQSKITVTMLLEN